MEGEIVVYRGFVVVIAITVAAALAAGCGGSDDESLTKAEFIKQGDEICLQAEETKNKALEKAFAAKGNKGSEKEFQEKLVTDVALPPIATMTDELQELGPPDDQAEAVVKAYEDVVGELEAEPELAFTTEEPFGRATKPAAKYGFKDCSEI